MRLIDGADGIITPPGEGKLNILRRFLGSSNIDGKIQNQFDEVINNIELNLDKKEYSLIKTIIKKNIEQHSSSLGLYGKLILLIKSFAEYKSIDITTRDFIWLEKNHNLEFYWARAQSLFGSPKLLFVLRDPFDNWASWKMYCKKNGLINSIEQARLNISNHLLNEVVEITFGISQFETVEALADHYKIKSSSMLELLRLFNLKSRQSVHGADLIDIYAYPGIGTPEGRFAWNYRMMYEKASSLILDNPENILLIKFEDMVQNTKECMGRVLTFCGLEISDINRTPTNNGEAWFGNSSFSRLGNKHSEIDTSSIGRGKESLNLHEVENIEKVIGDI